MLQNGDRRGSDLCWEVRRIERGPTTTKCLFSLFLTLLLAVTYTILVITFLSCLSVASYNNCQLWINPRFDCLSDCVIPEPFVEVHWAAGCLVQQHILTWVRKQERMGIVFSSWLLGIFFPLSITLQHNTNGGFCFSSWNQVSSYPQVIPSLPPSEFFPSRGSVSLYLSKSKFSASF